MEKQQNPDCESLVEKDNSIQQTCCQDKNGQEVSESAGEQIAEQRSSSLNDEMHVEAHQIFLLREKWKNDRTEAIRKRQTKKNLQSRRQIYAQELESDTIAFLNDLKDKVSVQGFNESTMQDLRKLKDILDFAIESPTQNIYQSYFETNAGVDSALMVHCCRSTQFFVMEFRNGNEQKQEELIIFTQILSSLLIILEDKEQECLQVIHKLILVSNLMRDSLAVCCGSNISRIKIQMMMLCSVFVRLSPEAALYVLSSGWINKIQVIVENSLLPGGFVLNSTVFFYHILKYLPLIDFPPEKASFCLKYLLTIMFDTLEKASVQLKVLDQLSDYVSLGLIKAKKIPLFREVVMNEKIISKVLQLLDRFSCISPECCLEGLLRLLCSILKEITKDQLKFLTQVEFIKQPTQIDVVLQFLNKNIAASESDEARKRCLQALIYLVEISPLVIDRLSQPLFIINIINSISNQSCRGEIIRVLHLLGAFGEDKIFREVMKETMVVSSLVKLFLIEDEMSLKEKRALSGLLLVLLKIGETENEENSENFAVREISRCGGEAKLSQMLCNESDNELFVNLELILDNYFRS